MKYVLVMWLLLAGQKEPVMHQAEMPSVEKCLEAAAEILKTDPADLGAYAMGASCSKGYVKPAQDS